MSIQLPTIACSTVELTFLAELLGAESLPGVPDPFAGLSPEEVATMYALAQKQLADRRLIHVQPDGTVGIEAVVAELVGTCCFSEATFMLTYCAADGTVAGHRFHVIRDSAVELELSHMSCHLTGLDTAAIMERVTEIFQLRDQPGPAVPNGRLTDAQVGQARKLAETAGAARSAEFLAEAGLCPTTARALARSFALPLGTGVLVVVGGGDGDEADVDGMALLEGDEGLWMLKHVHESGARFMDIVPCPADALREFLRSMMNRALPGKLV